LQVIRIRRFHDYDSRRIFIFFPRVRINPRSPRTSPPGTARAPRTASPRTTTPRTTTTARTTTPSVRLLRRQRVQIDGGGIVQLALFDCAVVCLSLRFDQ
jgi:hypothetical protein